MRKLIQKMEVVLIGQIWMFNPNHSTAVIHVGQKPKN